MAPVTGVFVVVPPLAPFGAPGVRAIGFCLMIDAEVTIGTDEDKPPDDGDEDEDEGEMEIEEEDEGAVEKEEGEDEEGGEGEEACWASWRGREK